MLNWQKLLQSRNDLVHHFMRLPEFDWMSPGSVNVAIEYLDKQFESTSFIYDVVHGNAAAALARFLHSPLTTIPTLLSIDRQ